MYRHPFANPEHLYAYGRDSPDLPYVIHRSPTSRAAPSPGVHPYRSFMPMASQSSFFGEHMNTAIGYPTPNPGPGRGRSASLPEPRSRQPQYRYPGGLTTTTWSEGMEDPDYEVQSEPAKTRSSWKRAFQRMRRRAKNGLQKVRALLHRDDRRSISGFSRPPAA